jgi:ADP-heptose:LPS heptosyltransferase
MIEAKRFLIVQVTRIGDMILLSPLLKAIKADNPQHHITVLAGKYNHSIIKNIPNIDHALIYEKKWHKYFSLKEMIKNYPHDIYIDPKDHYSGESAMLASFSQAEMKIGFNAKNKKQNFTHGIPSDIENSKLHAVERNLQLLNILKMNVIDSSQPLLRSSADSDARLHDFLPSAQISAYTLVNFSASVEERKWHPHRWIEFIQQFPETNFIISCEEKDNSKMEEILSACKNVYYYKSRNFTDVISLVKFADIVISPDTSLVHVASAFNKPIIALFQNDETNICKFRPLTSIHKVVTHPHANALIPVIATQLVLEAYKEITGILHEN